MGGGGWPGWDRGGREGVIVVDIIGNAGPGYCNVPPGLW